MTAVINAITRRLGAIPPDPDCMNVRRAEIVGDVLTEFCRIAHVDLEDALADLLTDTMHWCDRNKVDFGEELLRAQRNYDSETTP